MRDFELSYNSEREELVIPEYGRNVQNLICNARKIENLEERQAYIEHIVNLMMQMHPHNRNLEEYRDKIWKHVFRIANYDLDGVLPHNGEIPTPEDVKKRPERIGYPVKNIRYRHYGNNVHTMIARAIEMEEGTKKNGFIEVIGSYMKLAYKTWNKEHYVSDDIIIADLETLSEGKLELLDGAFLDNLTQANRKRRRGGGSDGGSYRQKDRGGYKHKGHKGRGGGGGRRKDRRDRRD